MNEPLDIKMTLDGLNFILKTLGALPTSSGAYPLMVELQEQGRAQLKATAESAMSAQTPS